MLARTGTGTGMGRAGAEAAHGLTTPELLESKLAPKEVLIPSSSSGISGTSTSTGSDTCTGTSDYNRVASGTASVCKIKQQL